MLAPSHTAPDAASRSRASIEPRSLFRGERRAAVFSVVIAGLDPAIHAEPSRAWGRRMDALVKPAHDESFVAALSSLSPRAGREWRAPPPQPSACGGGSRGSQASLRSLRRLGCVRDGWGHPINA